jgi:hypothetical protein
MMGLETIAADAIATLTAYFTKRVSGKLAEKTAEFYQKVKEKLSDDSDAKEALKRVEEKPESKSRQAALDVVMTEKMEEDPAFAEEINQIAGGHPNLKDGVCKGRPPLSWNCLVFYDKTSLT